MPHLLQALEAIEEALKAGAANSKLAELTSRFYTIIPHDFGRQVPPVIRDHETLQRKFDMLLVRRHHGAVESCAMTVFSCLRCWGTLRLLRGCRETQRKRREKCAHTLHVSAHPYLPLPPPPRMVLGRCPTHWMSTMNF